jgi:hypothetical protein
MSKLFKLFIKSTIIWICRIANFDAAQPILTPTSRDRNSPKSKRLVRIYESIIKVYVDSQKTGSFPYLFFPLSAAIFTFHLLTQ